MSLFDNFGFMRPAKSSNLIQALIKRAARNVALPENLSVLVDGSWLLNEVNYPKGSSFQNIARIYYKLLRPPDKENIVALK